VSRKINAKIAAKNLKIGILIMLMETAQTIA